MKPNIVITTPEESHSNVQVNQTPNGSVSAGREFTEIPMDANNTFKWKFMTINTPTPSADGLKEIQIGTSHHPNDFPQLEDGQRCLTDAIQCLPHNFEFTDPVFIKVALPNNTKPLLVYHKASDVCQDPAAWEQLQNFNSSRFSFAFTDTRTRPNKVFVFLDRKHLVLVLHHLCSFVIVEDERRIEEKEVIAAVYMSVNCSPEESHVNVDVALSCNAQQMVC